MVIGWLNFLSRLYGVEAETWYLWANNHFSKSPIWRGRHRRRVLQGGQISKSPIWRGSSQGLCVGCKDFSKSPIWRGSVWTV